MSQFLLWCFFSNGKINISLSTKEVGMYYVRIWSQPQISTLFNVIPNGMTDWLKILPSFQIKLKNKNQFPHEWKEIGMKYIRELKKIQENACNGTLGHLFLYFLLSWLIQHVRNPLCKLGIQVWNSKIDFNMEALSISCRNKHW